MYKDPVCGMDVIPEEAPGKVDQAGETYYFCSSACEQQFLREPARYTGGSQGAS